jgi:hypothetical protein
LDADWARALRFQKSAALETPQQRAGAQNMSNVISREVIEELRRQKTGPSPTPKLRREGASLKANGPDEISRLVAALIMAIQEQPSAGTEVGAA